MSRAVAFFALMLFVGCGGAAARGRVGSTRSRRAPVDGGLRLALALPPGADRCVVARPGLVPDRRRALLLRISQAEPLGWMTGGLFVAQAGVERTAPDGRRSAVWLLRTSAPAAVVRRRLARGAAVRVAFDGQPSRPGRGYDARFIDAHTLRLSRGGWPDAASGAETRCVAMAREEPAAVEVASRRGEPLLLGEIAQAPLRIDTMIEADAGHVVLSRQILMASARQAEARERDGLLLPSSGPLGGLLESDVEVYRRGRTIYTRTRLLWEDLSMAVEDERRMVAAAREDDLADRPRTVDRIDVRNLAVVNRQRRLWADALRAGHGEQRRRAALALRALLTAAFAEHPDELNLARDLGALLVRELSDGAVAAELAASVLATSPEEPEQWRVLRREGLSAVGADRLAVALVDDAVVGAAQAPAAAAALVAARARGVDYAFAESAWLAWRQLLARSGPARTRPVTSARLPLVSLVDTLLLLASAGREAMPAAAVYVFVRGTRRPWAELSWDAEQAPVMSLQRGDSSELFVGVATAGGDPHLRQVGRTIARLLEPGPTQVSVYVVPMRGSMRRPLYVWRLTGELDEDALVIARAAGGGSRVRWGSVARYVAAPLASLEPRTFPPGELTLEAEGSEDVGVAMRVSTVDETVTCEAEGLRVRCIEAPDHPGAARAFLRRFAARRLAADARNMRSRR